MNNINQVIYQIYNNIVLDENSLYTYRNNISIDKQYTTDELNILIQNKKFVLLQSISNKYKPDQIINDNIKVLCIIIIYGNDEYITKKPKLLGAPICKILTKEEIYEKLESQHIQPYIELSKIKQDDPMMVWFGAKSNDIIEYTILSEITLNKMSYMHVI